MGQGYKGTETPGVASSESGVKEKRTEKKIVVMWGRGRGRNECSGGGTTV